MDPRAKPVLEKMDADLRPASMAAAKLTGASLLREFLEHQLAPLRQYSLPMWRPHPSPAALVDGDLAAVLQSLVGGDVARLEGAPTPLFLRDDWEQVVESMPVFNGDGPVPMETPEKPVDVPSDDSSKEEEGGEREKGLTPRRLTESRGLPSPGAGPAFSASLRAMTMRMTTKTTTRTTTSRTAGARPRSQKRTGPG